MFVIGVEVLINTTIATYGRLDYAFNNAGINEEHGPLTDCTEAEWDRIISINLKGIWLCMKYEIPHMLKIGSGAIVNTASVVGLTGGRGFPAYVASKPGEAQGTPLLSLDAILPLPPGFTSYSRARCSALRRRRLSAASRSSPTSGSFLRL